MAEKKTQLTHLVQEKTIGQYKVVRLKDFIYKSVKVLKHILINGQSLLLQDKMVLIILDLEVLEHGPLVGKIIGNPLTLGFDGTVVRNTLLFLIRVDENLPTR